MALVLQDPKGGTLTDLRFDTPDVAAYRKFLIANNGVGAEASITAQLIETGFGKTDQSPIGNRSLITAAYTHSVRGAESKRLGVGPIAAVSELPAELSAVLLDGLLQLSTDTFTWASSIAIASINAAASQVLYSRYQLPSLPFITRVTLTNGGAATFTGISLTPPSADQLSTDGITYGALGAAISVGNLGPSASVTFWLKSNSILNIIAAELDVVQATVTKTSVPVQAAGGRAYCLVNDVTQYLTTIDATNISDEEEILDFIYKSANAIDRATRRRFDVQSVTETYDTVGQQKLVLDNYPIISIQEVQIKNLNNQLVTDIKSTDTNFATELIIDKGRGFITLPPASFPNATYPFAQQWFWPGNAYGPALLRGSAFDYSSRFGIGTANVIVTYIYGFQQPPEMIRDACMKLVVIELLKKKGMSDSQGVATEAIAGMSETFSLRGTSGGSGPYGHTISELQSDVDAACEYYRKRKWLTV